MDAVSFGSDHDFSFSFIQFFFHISAYLYQLVSQKYGNRSNVGRKNEAWYRFSICVSWSNEYKRSVFAIWGLICFTNVISLLFFLYALASRMNKWRGGRYEHIQFIDWSLRTAGYSKEILVIIAMEYIYTFFSFFCFDFSLITWKTKRFLISLLSIKSDGNAYAVGFFFSSNTMKLSKQHSITVQLFEIMDGGAVAADNHIP